MGELEAAMKVGDKKQCDGHEAVLNRVPESSASFGDDKVTGRASAPIVTPAHYVWVCECGERPESGVVEE